MARKKAQERMQKEREDKERADNERAAQQRREEEETRAAQVLENSSHKGQGGRG